MCICDQTRSVSAKTGGGNIVSEGLLQGDAVLEAKLDGVFTYVFHSRTVQFFYSEIKYISCS